MEQKILTDANGVGEEPTVLETEKHLISKMLCYTPNERPDISQCAVHPAFWSTEATAIFFSTNE